MGLLQSGHTGVQDYLLDSLDSGDLVHGRQAPQLLLTKLVPNRQTFLASKGGHDTDQLSKGSLKEAMKKV